MVFAQNKIGVVMSMGDNRTENSKRNIIYGFFSKIVSLLLPFIVRTVIIKEIGAEYLGLNGLFTSILTVLNVAELGIGNAIVYSMYKPVANNDVGTINALLKLYRFIYRAIGIVVLSVGLLLIPFLPLLVNGNVPNDISLLNLYIIYLLNTSISYFAFGYLRSLPIAFQREDYLSKITLVITIAQNIIQMVIIILFHNYYCYAIVLPIFTLITNLFVAIIARKHYSKYSCVGKVPVSIKNEIKKNMSGLVIAKIGGVSRNAFDNICISSCLGLLDVAIYNNYYYISSAITAMMVLIVSAITASVGNSVAVEGCEKNYSTMRKVNFLYMWIAGWCFTCMICLYQPFMTLWVGKSYLLPNISMVLFCVYFYALKLGDIQSIYMTSAGLYYEFKNCAIFQAVSNIVFNFLLVRYWGINGIIVATLFSIVVIDFLYGNRIVFKYYFKNHKISEYYKEHTMYFIVAAIAALMTVVCCLKFGFVIRIIICCVVPNVVFILFYHRNELYLESIVWLLNILNIDTKVTRKLLLIK